MNIVLQDAAFLRAIQPTEVAAYLRGQGWEQTETLTDKALVWTKSAGDGGDYEILLPLLPATSEFPRRMAEVIETLIVAEERSPLAILQDIAATTTDVMRIRLQHKFIEDGAIPLDYAVLMVEQTRELLLASACAAVRPRALYAARKPQEAIDYVRGLQMGQTEQGSFVINVRSAVEPRLQQSLFPEVSDTFDTAPFQRRVTLRLAAALAAVQKAITAASVSGEFAPFINSVSEGVSANLCYALAALGMDNTAEEVTIGIHWASTRPANVRIPREFRFVRGVFPLLRQAAVLLRETAPVEDFFLWGPVISLRRPETDEDGQVTVAAWMENSPRNVRMILDAADYETAVKAHAERDLISANGELIREGRSYILRHVRNFTIVSYPDVGSDTLETPSALPEGSPASPRREQAA